MARSRLLGRPTEDLGGSGSAISSHVEPPEGYLLRRDEKMADKDDQDGLKLMCKQHHGQKGPIFDQWALIYLLHDRG